jgi:outer membrane lipoprotein-sorting protein
MKCPLPNDWELMAMQALDAPQTDALAKHAGSCAACRELLLTARRAHVDRLRRYEAFDRDHDRLREELIAALPAESPARPAGWLRRIGERIMTMQPVARRAAILLPAACLVLGTLFVLSWNQPSAFAAALAKIRDARTIVAHFEAFMNAGEAPMQSGTLYLSEEFGMRFDAAVGPGMLAGVAGQPFGMSISHKHGQPVVMRMPAMNIVMRMHTPDGEMHGWSGGFDQSSPAKFLEGLRGWTGKADADLGRSTIDGRAVEGFEIRGEKLGIAPLSSKGDSEADAPTARLWVETGTHLPVRMEIEMSVEAPPLGLVRMRISYDRFEFDTPLPESTFEQEIPAGAKVIDVNVPAPDEQTLLKTLRMLADATGSYPEELDPARLTAELTVALARKNALKIDFSDPASMFSGEMMESIMGMSMGFAFIQKLRSEGSVFEYFGDDVTPEDADKVLLRWTLPKDQVALRGGTHVVVYGDLRLEVTTP